MTIGFQSNREPQESATRVREIESRLGGKIKIVADIVVQKSVQELFKYELMLRRANHPLFIEIVLILFYLSLDYEFDGTDGSDIDISGFTWFPLSPDKVAGLCEYDKVRVV